jgi:hypothetical protein
LKFQGLQQKERAMSVNNIADVAKSIRLAVFESIVRLFCKKPFNISAIEVDALRADLSELNPQWWLNLVELCRSFLGANIVSCFPAGIKDAALHAVVLVADPDIFKISKEVKEVDGTQVYEYLLLIFAPQEDDTKVLGEMYRVVEKCFRPPDTDSDTDSGEPTTRVITQSPPFAPPPSEPVEPAPVTKSDPPIDHAMVREMYAKAQGMMAAANKLTVDAEVHSHKADIAMGRAEQMKKDLEKQRCDMMLGYSDAAAAEIARKFLATLDIAADNPEFLNCLDMGKVVLKGIVVKNGLSLQYKALLSESDGLQGDIRAEDAKILVLRSDLRKRMAEKGQLERNLNVLVTEIDELRGVIKDAEDTVASARAKHDELNPLVAELQEETERLQALLEDEKLRAAAQHRTTEAGVATVRAETKASIVNARAEIDACKQEEAEKRAQLKTVQTELASMIADGRAAYEEAVERCTAECDRLNGLIQQAIEQTELARAEAEAKILSGKKDAGQMSEKLNRTLQSLADLVRPSK